MTSESSYDINKITSEDLPKRHLIKCGAQDSLICVSFHLNFNIFSLNLIDLNF